MLVSPKPNIIFYPRNEGELAYYEFSFYLLSDNVYDDQFLLLTFPFDFDPYIGPN
jgi:hypothetical protein